MTYAEKRLNKRMAVLAKEITKVRTRKKKDTRSVHEKRIRKEVRWLIQMYNVKAYDEEKLVRELFRVIDDERRRCFQSMPPDIN
jgi:hypothetical protein